MSGVDGTYETVVKSPMGDQKATLTVKSDGNTISWSMSITVPMPMTLDCSATIDGDTLTGSVKAGAFGSFPMTGKRV